MSELLIKGFRDKEQVNDFIGWWSNQGEQYYYDFCKEKYWETECDLIPTNFSSQKETENGYEMEIK